MKPLSSRLKIALLSAGISGAVLVAFGLMLWVIIHHQRLATVDREIRTLASRHPGLLAGRGSFERLGSSLEFTFGDDYTNHVALLIRDANGQITYRSPHWPAGLDLTSAPEAVIATNAPAIVSDGALHSGFGRGYGQGRGGPPPELVFTRSPQFFTVKTAHGAWRFGRMGNDEVTLLLGLNQAEMEAELNHLRNVFLLVLPAALMLVALGGWVVAGQALRPLTMIADTAEKVTIRGLDQRIPRATDSPEAIRLIHVLNRMMDRLENSFHQATRFSADASHELKTPLAIMQGELENALQTAVPGSAEQQLFSNLLEETQRLKTITRSLLLLAQADAGQLRLTREMVDLTAELESMLEDAQVLAADAGLQFDVQLTPVRIPADRALLHTAIFNLIHNAVKYNQDQGKIALHLIAKGQHFTLTIGNTGPGIPPTDRARIFDRFYRGQPADGTRRDGIGLGLSLTREIIRAHGGDVSLLESRDGWTVFELVLNLPPAGQH